MITTKQVEREKGIVFIDEATSARPSTHVMIVGVGAYKSADLAGLTSPPISSRALADWFLTPSTGFNNPQRPLGSLAMTLSELDEPQSEYAGGPVPRASHEQVKMVLRGWVARASANPGNLAILFMSGHGESLLRKTGFLFEDYNSDPMDATAGMTEIEQLMSSLELGVPGEQLLLFDCCRTPTALDLDDDAFGTPLIRLERNRDHPAATQWGLCSTSFLSTAVGRKNKTTLFTECLLDALNGVAADASEQNWPVRPSLVLDRITKLLRWHAHGDEAPQTPGGRVAGSFDIAFPTSKQTKTYVALGDRQGWVGSTLAVRDPNGNLLAEHVGIADEPPFYAGIFDTSAIDVSVRRNGELVGEENVRLSGPVQFVEIQDRQPIALEALGHAMNSGPATVEVSVQSEVELSNSFVLSINRIVSGSESPLLRKEVVGSDEPFTFSVDPGSYRLDIALPDGKILTRNLVVEAGTAIQMVARSPASSVLDRLPQRGVAMPSSSSLQAPLERDLGRTTTDLAVPTPSFEILQGLLDGTATAKDFLGRAGFPSIVARNPTGTALTQYVPASQSYWRLGDPHPQHSAVWSLFSTRTGHEVAFVPTLGAGDDSQSWWPRVVLDRSVPAGAFATRSEVISRQWESLVGFLALRDFENGQEIALSLISELRLAMEEKRRNPIAAIAAALIAVGARREAFPTDWLSNLSNWFEHIPDGPIILARHQLVGAHPDIDEIRLLLHEAIRRGVPFFALSGDWLLRGLELTARSGTDDLLLRQVRRIVRRMDPTQAFSVIKIDRKG